MGAPAPPRSRNATPRAVCPEGGQTEWDAGILTWRPERNREASFRVGVVARRDIGVMAKLTIAALRRTAAIAMSEGPAGGRIRPGASASATATSLSRASERQREADLAAEQVVEALECRSRRWPRRQAASSRPSSAQHTRG